MGLYEYIKDLILASASINLVLPIFLLLLLNLGLCILGQYGYPLPESDAPLITGLSLTVGLLLAFRNNVSYDRYWEGRKQWSQIHLSCRNLARSISVQVHSSNGSVLEEKKYILEKIILLAYTIKDELRKEANKIKEHSLGYWLNDINRPRTIQDNENDLKLLVQNSRKYRMRANSDSKGNKDIIIKSDDKQEEIKAKPKIVRSTALARGSFQETSIIKIIVSIEEFIYKHLAAGNLDNCQSSLISNYLSDISNANLQCQTIARTPIPPAYSIHLNIMVTLYCISFPFSIVNDLSYYSLLVSFVVFFVLIGIHNIGIELENPFGFQYNDLPLEQYCSNIKDDIDDMIKFLAAQEESLQGSVLQTARLLLPGQIE